MNRLRDVLDGQQQAKAVNDDQTAKREEQRAHIRSKLCKVDRDFMDLIVSTFPGAKVVGIKFNDGETIGRI